MDLMVLPHRSEKRSDPVATEGSLAGLLHSRLLLASLFVLLVVDRVGAVLTGYLAPRHPLLLVGLDATDRAVLLALHVSIVPLVAVAVARRLLGQLLYFTVGRHLGGGARRWLARQGLAGPMGTVEQLFRRAAIPAISALPREVICLLAGDTGVPMAIFASIVVVRDVAVVLVLRLVSQALRDPIDSVLSFLSRYTIPATIVGGALTLVSVLWQRRRRRAVEPVRVVIPDDGVEVRQRVQP